jgi:hypothetical protein
MSSDDASLDHAVRDFLALNARDRSAVLARLSPSERRVLEGSQKPHKRSAPPPEKKAPGPDFSAYSPVVAKHLLRLIADQDFRTSKLTALAQEALHAGILHPADAGETR